MKTTPLDAYAETAEKSFAAGARLHIETVDCEICGSRFLPHLLDLPNGAQIGLCSRHLRAYSGLYARSVWNER